MQERRQFLRLSARMKVTYRVVGAIGPFRSLTTNVGGGGMSLFTVRRLAPGTVLKMHLKLPGRLRPVAFTAEVIWSGALLEKAGRGLAFETGVRFLDLSPENRGLIMQCAALPVPPAWFSAGPAQRL